MRKGYVYFLRAEDGAGPIKIGHSIIPEGRVRTMADWSPIKRTIIHQTEGGAGSLSLAAHPLPNRISTCLLASLIAWRRAGPRTGRPIPGAGPSG